MLLHHPEMYYQFLLDPIMAMMLIAIFCHLFLGPFAILER